MTKQTYRKFQRVKPLGMEGIEQLREVLKNGYKKINEIMVDTYTASAILKIYDQVGERAQTTLVNLPLARVADISFKLLNKYSK